MNSPDAMFSLNSYPARATSGDVSSSTLRALRKYQPENDLSDGHGGGGGGGSRCAAWWNTKAAKAGLLFADPGWEREYQTIALNSLTNRILVVVFEGAFILCLFLVGAGLVDIVSVSKDDGSDLLWASQTSTVWLTVMVAIFTVSAALHCIRFCVGAAHKARVTTSATLVAFLGAYFFLPYSYCAEKLYLFAYQHTVTSFVSNVRANVLSLMP